MLGVLTHALIALEAMYAHAVLGTTLIQIGTTVQVSTS